MWSSDIFEHVRKPDSKRFSKGYLLQRQRPEMPGQPMLVPHLSVPRTADDGIQHLQGKHVLQLHFHRAPHVQPMSNKGTLASSAYIVFSHQFGHIAGVSNNSVQLDGHQALLRQKGGSLLPLTSYPSSPGMTGTIKAPSEVHFLITGPNTCGNWGPEGKDKRCLTCWTYSSKLRGMLIWTTFRTFAMFIPMPKATVATITLRWPFVKEV